MKPRPAPRTARAVRARNPDHRISGIPSVGPLPWGSRFCQFYRTKKDLLDVLVPYFRAGLENNESCVWVLPGGLREAEAASALRKAVPGFEDCAAAGRMRIVAPGRWPSSGARACRAILSWLDEALAGGFDGLRIACESLPGKGGRDFLQDGSDPIPGNQVIAAFTYPRVRLDPPGVMEVVKNHRFALVRNAGRWEVIESSEARTVKDELRRTEEKLKFLFSNMSEGFAYHRVVLDSRGRPCDCIFLEVNDAFERMTGLKGRNVIGRRATAVLPGIVEEPVDWIAKFGKVAMTGRPMQIETCSERLGRWFLIFLFSPRKGYVAATFSDVTKQKRAEETIRQRNVVLDGLSRILRLGLTSPTEEELGRKCLGIAEEVTRSRFGFIGEIGPDGRLNNLAISDPGWELCKMPRKDGHRGPPVGFEVHGLYGRVVLDGKGFFTNDPASHPDSIGTPPGHPRLSAFLGVPLVQEGKTIGMVGMGNREGGYRAEDLDALAALSGAMVQALMRKRAEGALLATVTEKEILLRELAHRTKNNMQIIGSLLSLQASSSTDEKFVGALAETQDRIGAMALVHEKLYRSGNFASLNMREYLKDLMDSLIRACRWAGGTVNTHLDLEDISFPIDAALPCGLIINELVSNSLKHAFSDRISGSIFVSLRRAGEKIELAYRDDGPGLPPDLDLSRGGSLGLKLVYNLAVRQLRGEMEIRRNPAAIVFTFGEFSQLGRK